MRTRIGYAAGLGFALWTVAGSARADDVAAAQVLFTDARQLMASGNYAAACPKLEESQRLDPGMGTLYNLADCFEHEGRVASAWGRFLEVASLARNTGQPAREADARKRAAALESRIPHLVIAVAAPAPDGLQVTRDGEEVGRAQWGSSLPIDPGAHKISATAVGKKPWDTTVTIAEGGTPTTVEVPTLADAPVAPPPPPAAAGPKTTAPPPTEEHDGKGQRMIALGVGGLGVVGIGLGTVFGLVSKSRHDEAETLCAPPNGCGQAGVDKRSDAYTAGTISTVAFIVGGVALAGGVALWLTAPHGATQAKVGFTGDRLVVGGAF